MNGNIAPKSIVIGVAGNPHATFCGSRGRATASGDQVGDEKFSSLPRPSRHVRWFRIRPIPQANSI